MDSKKHSDTQVTELSAVILAELAEVKGATPPDPKMEITENGSRVWYLIALIFLCSMLSQKLYVDDYLLLLSQITSIMSVMFIFIFDFGILKIMI